MTTATRAALGAITSQVYALLLDEGLIPSLAVGEVHELALSIDAWGVEEADRNQPQHITTDGESWVTARGVLRRERHGQEDGRAEVVIDGQGFLLFGEQETPPTGTAVEVTGLVYVEPARMPVFGWPNPMALPRCRPWRVVGLRRELLQDRRTLGRPAPGSRLDRLPEPSDVDTNSYYFADLELA